MPHFVRRTQTGKYQWSKGVIQAKAAIGYAEQQLFLNAPDGRKVRGTLHWVSASNAVTAEVRLYDRLFTEENPLDHGTDEDFTDFINPGSLSIIENAFLETSLENAKPGERYQFERCGYFCVDPDTGKGGLVFNRTVSLRDTWAKIQRKHI